MVRPARLLPARVVAVRWWADGVARSQQHDALHSRSASVAMTSVTGNRCAFTATAALGRRICGDVAGWRRAAAARQMSVAGAYRELVSAGEIRADAEQERLAGELDAVVSAVEARERVRSFAGGRLARLLSPRAAGECSPPLVLSGHAASLTPY